MSSGWRTALEREMAEPYFAELQSFVRAERESHTVYPPEGEVYAALRLTPLESVRVVILGQDPYHGPGQAHGLCFSVPRDVAPPPSLRNVFTELASDLRVAPPRHGNLEHWARQGVLLLNTTLTVRAGEAGSHAGRGWERFTDRAVAVLGSRDEPCVFVLWGSHARRKRNLVTSPVHTVIESAHPSPLSAHNGFFGSRPFSRIDAALAAVGGNPIEWVID